MCVKRAAEISDGKSILRIARDIKENEVCISTQDKTNYRIEMKIPVEEFEAFLSICHGNKFVGETSQDK